MYNTENVTFRIISFVILSRFSSCISLGMLNCMIINMKKNLESDWLREMQFLVNLMQK